MTDPRPQSPRHKVPLGVQAAAVQRFMRGQATVDDLAKEHQVTAKTVREWVRVYKNGAVMRDMAAAPGAGETPPKKPPATEKPATPPAKTETAPEKKKFDFF